MVILFKIVDVTS